MDTVARLQKRAKAIAALSQLIEALDTRQERLAYIKKLGEYGVVSDMAVDLIIEHFSLETA